MLQFWTVWPFLWLELYLEVDAFFSLTFVWHFSWLSVSESDRLRTLPIISCSVGRFYGGLCPFLFYWCTKILTSLYWFRPDRPPPLISIDSSQSWHSAPLVVSQDLGTVCRCPSTLACNSHFCSSLEFLLNKHYQLCLITVQFYFISKFDGLVPLCQDSGRSKAALIPLSDASSSLLDMQIAAQGICLNAIYCSRLLVAHLLIKYVMSTSDSVLLQISV